MNEMTATDAAKMDPEELRDAARRLLQDLVNRRAAYLGPAEEARSALYAAMVEQGWTLLTLPADQGGLDQDYTALAPIYEEMGRAVAPVFLIPTLAALEALRSGGATEAAGRLAEGVAAGEARLALAIDDEGALRVSGGVVSGALTSVIVDPGVTHLLVLTSGPAREALLVDLAGQGGALSPVEMWDRSRAAADIRLDGAPVQPLGGSDAASRIRGHVELALAWDSLGGARQSLEETLAYMGVRHQFGRPIGSFQALKHRAADHKVRIELAAALAQEATRAFAAGEPEAEEKAIRARLFAVEAYRAMSEDSVQLHGGIGFTWEHDCHLFLKRAFLNEALFGPPEARRDQVAGDLFARALADHAA